MLQMTAEEQRMQLGFNCGEIHFDIATHSDQCSEHCQTLLSSELKQRGLCEWPLGIITDMISSTHK